MDLPILLSGLQEHGFFLPPIQKLKWWEDPSNSSHILKSKNGNKNGAYEMKVWKLREPKSEVQWSAAAYKTFQKRRCWWLTRLEDEEERRGRLGFLARKRCHSFIFILPSPIKFLASFGQRPLLFHHVTIKYGNLMRAYVFLACL